MSPNQATACAAISCHPTRRAKAGLASHPLKPVQPLGVRHTLGFPALLRAWVCYPDNKRVRGKPSHKMIPPFDPVTGALPPGIHEATWTEVVERYGFNENRLSLMAGMQ